MMKRRMLFGAALVVVATQALSQPATRKPRRA
jgi:hypothetical protein